MILKNNKHIFILLMFFSIVLFFFSCTSKHSAVKSSGLKNISIAKEDLLNAQFCFYKNSDTTVLVYFYMNTNALLFARLDTGIQFYASVKVNVYLYSASKNILSDSVSRVFYVPQTQSDFLNFLFVPAGNDSYNVKISITDNNKKTQYVYYTELKLNNDNTRNNFLITHDDKILFKPYLTEENVLKIYHRKKYPYLYVDIFRYNNIPASPPFSNITASFNYLPDSSFTIPLVDRNYYTLRLKRGVYYHVRPEQSQLDGLSIFSIDSVFPNIKDAREMLYTSRYIMSKNEFERCSNLTNISDVKKCIDNFWVQVAGSKERGKEVIKNYYQRVIEANKLFTSYKYGWQTDRGMIYIVFGPPEDIQRSFNTEKWYYSVNKQKNALVFNFYKNKSNPFTSSDFILERSDYYKDIWYLSVEKIREGRLSMGR